MDIAVRIDVNKKGEIVIKRIKYSRFCFYGFGSFIKKMEPEEISISQEALNLLNSRVGQQYTSLGDLAGLDFRYNEDPKSDFFGLSLNYGFLGYKLNVPIEDVLIDFESFKLIEKRSIIESKRYSYDEKDKERFDLMLSLDKEGKEKDSNKIYKKYYQTKYTIPNGYFPT